MRAKLENWRGLLTGQVVDGRQLLRESLIGPLKFTPEGRQHRFAGEVRFSVYLQGLSVFLLVMASPGGLEPPAYRLGGGRSIH